jgi:hypothetical protein
VKDGVSGTWTTAASAPVGILNGFGRTLGDGIIGLQALHVAIQVGALPSRPVLFRLPDLPAMVRKLYRAADFAEIRPLPWDFATTERRFDPGGAFAGMIELRDFAFDPDFQQMAMIDFFLRRLGVPPYSVPAAWRRNTWLAPRVMPAQPEFPPGYILVCPQASMRLRQMPGPIHAYILRQALAIGPVLTQGTVPDPLRGDVVRSPPCETLEALCSLVRHAKLVISTDTAMVHLADAFEVPCLAFFPTHRPEWRVRDYPRCLPIALQSRLPPGIEFARGPGDDELARLSWFPHGDDFGWLNRAMARAHERFVGEAIPCASKTSPATCRGV